MKTTILLLPIFSVIISSCSPSIYNTAKHSDILRFGVSKEKIVAKLGKPTHIETIKDDKALYEEYFVEGPVFDFGKYSAASLSSAMTLGIAEFYNFPQALWWWFTNYGAKSVQITYSSDNKIQWISVGDIPENLK